MPADLFRPNVAETPSRRRVSLLPVSIALHATAIAAFLIVPLVADVELPPPSRRVSPPYFPLMPVAPPVALWPRPVAAKPAPEAPSIAPVVAPTTIAPEREIATLGAMLPGSDFGAVEGVDPGLLPVTPSTPAPSEPPESPKVVRPGGQIEPPRKIRNVSPLYPSIAQTSRVQGTVILEAVIGVDGRVEHVKVLRPVMLLTESAVEAVRQWVFTPTRLNGEPVQVVMTVTVDFRLQ